MLATVVDLRVVGGVVSSQDPNEDEDVTGKNNNKNQYKQTKKKL